MNTKKEGFNASKYATKYIKEHYKRKEVKLKPSEAEKVEAVLSSKRQDLKSYLLEHIEKDYISIYRDAKK